MLTFSGLSPHPRISQEGPIYPSPREAEGPETLDAVITVCPSDDSDRLNRLRMRSSSSTTMTVLTAIPSPKILEYAPFQAGQAGKRSMLLAPVAGSIRHLRTYPTKDPADMTDF